MLFAEGSSRGSAANLFLLALFCPAEEKYLNLQNNKQKNKKYKPLKKYQNMNDADGQKT